MHACRSTLEDPTEFAEDHVPGAINLPVLSNAERAEVGEIYVQKSPFLARRIGAAHVARNIAAHLQGALAGKPADWRPLIYCWRGGMRSGAMATVLSQVGWRVSVLDGGYKTWRGYVRSRLYDQPLGLKIVLLDGGTGTAKTEILGLLAARGVQMLDMEGLARHRGSLFGALPGQPQPDQKMFESRLLADIHALDPARPVVVEAESSKIGERFVPPSLWAAMQAAPRIEVSAPLEARAAYLARTYADAVQDPAAVATILGRLPRMHGKARIDGWVTMAQQSQFEELAVELIEAHYDPAYRRSSGKDKRAPLYTLTLNALDTASLAEAADALGAVIENAAGRA